MTAIKFDSRSVFFGLAALTALLVVSIGFGAYESNNLFITQANKLTDARAHVTVLTNEQSELATAKHDIAQYSDIYNIARTIVPESKDQAQAVRQISDLANASGVYLQSVTFPTSTLGGTTTSTSSNTISTPKTSTKLTQKDLLSQLKAVPKISGVYDLQLIVTSGSQAGQTPTYGQMIKFLQGLETNRLTAIISSISIAPAASASTGATTNNTDLSFSLTLNIYIKPEATK